MSERRQNITDVGGQHFARLLDCRDRGTANSANVLDGSRVGRVHGGQIDGSRGERGRIATVYRVYVLRSQEHLFG